MEVSKFVELPFVWKNQQRNAASSPLPLITSPASTFGWKKRPEASFQLFPHLQFLERVIFKMLHCWPIIMRNICLKQSYCFFLLQLFAGKVAAAVSPPINVSTGLKRKERYLRSKALLENVKRKKRKDSVSWMTWSTIPRSGWKLLLASSHFVQQCSWAARGSRSRPVLRAPASSSLPCPPVQVMMMMMMMGKRRNKED